MKFKYRQDVHAFKKCAQEFFNKINARLYIISAIVLFFGVLFAVFQPIVNPQENYVYTVILLCADVAVVLFIVAVSIRNKIRFVNGAVDTFYGKYQDNAVSYSLEFDETGFTLSNDFTESAITVSDEKVSRVVVTKNSVAVIVGDTAYFFAKDGIGAEGVEYIKQRYPQKPKKTR